MATKKLLTEQEILAMGEDDYMNDAQLAFFKHRLTQMENELQKNADKTTETLRETTVVPDPADRATIEEEHALELRTRDRERKLLKKVKAALKRSSAAKSSRRCSATDFSGVRSGKLQGKATSFPFFVSDR